MENTIKGKWVAALRSGEYEQTQGALVRDFETGNPTYCCLGVLGVVKGLTFSEGGDFFTNEVPQKVRDEFDEMDESLHEEYPQLCEDMIPNQIEKCISLNDAEKLSFKDIADHIEKHF